MDINQSQGFVDQVKKNYIFAFRSALAVLTFWFALFAVLNVARSISSTWVAISANFSDAESALIASGALVVGLGGTLLIGSGDPVTLQLSAAFLFLVVPIAFYYTLRAFHKGKQTNFANPATAGSYSAFGAVFAVLAIVFFTSGAFAESGASFGFVSLVPFVVAAIMGFAVVPGAVKSTILSKFSLAALTFNKAFRGTMKYLITVLIALASYVALIMGTGLVGSFELWIWFVAALGGLLVLPTVAALLIPVYLGSLIPMYLELTKLYPLLKSDYEWTTWVILVFAWIAVVVAAVRSANRGNVGKSLWFTHALINLGVGALLVWLGSFRIKADIPLDWVNVYSNIAAQQNLLTIAIFAASGALFGLLAHPRAQKLNGILTIIGQALRDSVDAILFVVALRWSTPLNNLKKKFRSLSFALRRTLKYSMIGAMVAGFFLIGQPLATVTAPFYDSENYADGKFKSALENGNSSELKDLTKTLGYIVLSSSGLGSGSDLQIVDPQEVLFEKAKADREQRKINVEKAKGKFSEPEVSKPDEKNLRQINWQQGKYFIELDYDRSLTKDAFWGIIPQWDVAVTNLSLPKISLYNGSAELKVLLVDGKSYNVDEVIILPGMVTLEAGVDKSRFLVSNKVEADVSKDAKVKFTITLDNTKAAAIHSNISSAMEAEFTGCSKFKYESTGAPSLGSIDSSTGLPSLVANGKGVCTDENYGDLPFKVKATGKYSIDEAKWLWTYEF